MNDNYTIKPSSIEHAQALALIAELQALLEYAAGRGIDVYDDDGEAIFDFGYWAGECQKVLLPSVK